MDPITTAIVALMPEFATSALKSVVKDAYEGLKAVIRRKWGDSGPIKAISGLEKDPKSKAQAALVQEKLLAAKACEDAEVLAALRELVDQMKSHGVGGDAAAKIQFTMSGGVVQGVAGAENVQIGSMNFGEPPKR